MAHNAFIHGGTASPTAWLPGYVPTQLDWQTFDQRQFESVNGDLGGTWAPSSVITIGGSGLTISGQFTANGTTTINGTLTTGTTHITGQSFVWNKMLFDGANVGEAQFTSGALLDGLAGATFTWAGPFTVSHTSTFTAVATFSDITVTGAATLANAGVTGTAALAVATIATSLTCLTGGYIKCRELVGGDADIPSVAANQYDMITVVGALTAPRTYTLADAPNGSLMFVSCWNMTGANALHLHRADTTNIINLGSPSTTVQYAVVLIVRAGVWQIHTVTVFP